MKYRYLPIIIDETGKEYQSRSYRYLCDAVEGLEFFIQVFNDGNDHKIVDAYILNKITGKEIRP